MKNVFLILKICAVAVILFIVLMLSVSADASYNKGHLEKYITESLSLHLEKIDVYEFKCGEKEIFDAIDRVMKSNPQFYYVANRFYYSMDLNGVVEEITPTYVYSSEEVKNIKKYCDREIEKILFYTHENMSDLQKLVTLHEYMCEKFEYDKSFESCTMYDLLRTGRGTCQAFTLTFMELMSRLGIESSYAYSNEIMHIWNLVKLDGKWYHVDLTWDNLDAGISHKNFLLTDKEALDLGHRGYINANGAECTSEKYTSLTLRESPYKHVAFLDGFVYIDNISRNVCFDKLDGSDKSALYRIDELWQKDEGRYFANSFSSPVAAGNKVYFNTKNKIMAIDDSLTVSLVKALDFDAFGIVESNGKVACLIDRGGNEPAEIDIPKSLDADGDGELTVLDIAALEAYLGGREVFVNKYNVDANGDCRLDGEDLRELARLLLVIDKSRAG